MTEFGDPMTCRIILSKRDYAVMNEAQLYLPKKFNRSMVVRLTLFVLIVGCGIWVTAQLTGDDLSYVLPAMIAGGAVALIMMAVFRKFLAKMYGRFMAQVYYGSFRVDKSEQFYHCSDDGIAVENENFSSSFKWHKFHSIMRAQQHIVLWINPLQAHIIPLRALSDQDAQRFWVFLSQFPMSKSVKVSG